MTLCVVDICSVDTHFVLDGKSMGSRDSLEAAAFRVEREHLLSELLPYLYTCSLVCKNPISRKKGQKKAEG